MTLVCEADMLLQGMVGGWAVIEASHTVSSGLNVTCHMLIGTQSILMYHSVVKVLKKLWV